MVSRRNKSANGKVTIVDVAREAGVSTQTISRVINEKADVTEETRQHVQQVIERLGYRPNRAARSLASNRTATVGLVISDITNPFYPELVRGVEEVALSRNHNVLLFDTDSKPERERFALNLLEEHRVDGVIICASRLPNDELEAQLRRIPAAVTVNRMLNSSAIGSVRVDDYLGATLATRHLLDSGHQRTAFITAQRSMYSGPQRLKAYADVLSAYKLTSYVERVAPAKATIEHGYEVMQQILAQYPDTNGVLCFNDRLAVGAIQACKETGIAVPEQIAIMGFDDISLAALVTPSLTSMRVSTFELGTQAAQLLFERMNGQLHTKEVVITPELIIRQSAP